MNFSRLLFYCLISFLAVSSFSCKLAENERVDDWATAEFLLESFLQNRVGPSLSQGSAQTVLISVVPDSYSLESNTSIPSEYYDQSLLELNNYTVKLAVPLGKPLRLVQNVYNGSFSLDSITTNVPVAYSIGISDTFEVYSTADVITVNISLTDGPTVSNILPADSSTDVAINSIIAITFSNSMDSSSVSVNTNDTSCSGTIQVSTDDFESCVQMSSAPVASDSNRTFTLTPASNLNNSTTYKTKVSNTVTDTAGNCMTSDYTTTTGFTTAVASADTTAPTNLTTSINSGTASTTSTSVTLTLSASDNVGVVAYYASESSTTPSIGDSGWVSVTSSASYSGSGAFTLSSGTATKTIYLWFKDETGNISSSDSDTIVLNDLADGLMAYYPFNGNANDETGNGHNGTVNGATLTTDRNANANSAYNFDGNDYIDVGSFTSVEGATEFTFSAWIKSNNGATAYIFSKGRNQPYLLLGSGNDLMGGDAVPAGLQCVIDGNAVVSTGTWHHVSLVWKGGSTTESKIIFNDLDVTDTVDSDCLSMPSVTVTGLNLYIGTVDILTNYYNGEIDDVRIYNRALSASEITALYNE